MPDGLSPFADALNELRALPDQTKHALLVRGDYHDGTAKAVVAYKHGDHVELGAEMHYSQDTRGFSAGGVLLLTWD